MSPHEHSVKIYYEDTDAAGVVYYANYLRYMERARSEWLSAHGLSLRQLADVQGIGFIVRGVEIQYRSPARLDDVLVVRTRPVKLGRAGMTLSQEIFIAASERLATSARVDLACIDVASMRPRRLPQAVSDLAAAAIERASPDA